MHSPLYRTNGASKFVFWVEAFEQQAKHALRTQTGLNSNPCIEHAGGWICLLLQNDDLLTPNRHNLFALQVFHATQNIVFEYKKGKIGKCM